MQHTIIYCILVIFLLFSLRANSSSDIKKWCLEVASKLYSVKNKDCLKINFQTSSYKTYEGRPLVYREVLPNLENKAPSGKVLLIGGIHGDEYASISISILWLQLLLNSKNRAKNNYQWFFLPLANPDGLMASQRQNSRGVDINRNFHTPHWSRLALRNWKTKYAKNPRRYPGTYAASEVETEWIQEIIERYKPDVIISIHTPYGILDYDGPKNAKPSRIGYLRLRPLGTFPGSLGRYAGEVLGVPILTVELKETDKLPSKPVLYLMWKDLNKWIERKIKQRELDF